MTGLSYALLNVVIRPVVVLFTCAFAWLIPTMFLTLNALLFWLLTPPRPVFTVSSPGLVLDPAEQRRADAGDD